MKKHLKFIDDTSDKFWQIEVSGLVYTVTYGKNGTSGTSQTKTFQTAEECLKIAEKLLAEKIKKGYSEDGTVTVEKSASKSTSSGKKSNLQEVLDEYDEIIKFSKFDDLLPFLQEKTKGNLEGIKKHIKKCKRYWMTYTDLSNEPQFKTNSSYNWGTRGNQGQQKIIVLSAIALFDKTEITSWSEVFNYVCEANNKYVSDILEWAKPNWLGSYLLDIVKKREWQNIEYHALRLLEEKGLVEFNPELTALSLANYNEWSYRNTNKHSTRQYIEYLCNDELVCKRDIYELFNYETVAHNTSFRDNDKQSYNEFYLWAIVFNRLIEEKKLDRTFFIENCLQIQTKEWNNNLKSFFRKRLEELNPSQDELVKLQETIFTFFHSPFAPIVTYGAELVKQIFEHTDFNTESFLEWVSPIMMRADCKAAFKVLIPVFEKITKNNAAHSKAIALLLIDIFVVPDMALQERIAKLMNKIADEKEEEIKEKILMYSTQMQGNVKNALSKFFDDADNIDSLLEDDLEHYHFAPQKPVLLSEEVVLPSDWNDITFQFGKFISSKDTLDAELLINTFVTQRHLFPQDYADQLQPYFQQFQKKYFEAYAKNIQRGFFMIKMLNIDAPYKASPQGQYEKNKTLHLCVEILASAEKKIASGSTLPLLSMPSHAPYWIAPKVLLERIIAHQDAKESIEITDLAIAISRMPRENVEEALPLLPKLDDALRSLFEFCFGLHKEIKFSEGESIFNKLLVLVGGNTKKTENIALWAVAARTFYPSETFPAFEKTYIGDTPFVTAPFRPQISFKEKWNEWKNYQTKLMERSPSWYELHFEMPAFKKIPTYLLYSVDMFKKSNYWEYGLHSFENVTFSHSLTPQNHEPLAYTLLASACLHSDYSSNDLKGFLDIINRPEFTSTDVSALVFACCFFQDKKEIRFLTTEVLINLIQNQSLDLDVLGEKFAYLVSEKYGVLLRMIETLVAIKDVSPLHNMALFTLLDNIFKNLTIREKLPTNFKKLVENYLDLSAKLNQKPSEKAAAFFEKWKNNNSIKGLIKQINNI